MKCMKLTWLQTSAHVESCRQKSVRITLVSVRTLLAGYVRETRQSLLQLLITSGLARPGIRVKAGRRTIKVCPIGAKLPPVKIAAYAVTLEVSCSVTELGISKQSLRGLVFHGQIPKQVASSCAANAFLGPQCIAFRILRMLTFSHDVVSVEQIICCRGACVAGGSEGRGKHGRGGLRRSLNLVT
jgi:hypothetical protein